MSDSRLPLGLLFGATLVAAVLGAFLTNVFRDSDGDDSLGRSDLQSRLDDVIVRLDETKDAQDQLNRDLAALRKTQPQALPPSSDGGLSESQVEAIVRKILAEEGQASAATKEAETGPTEADDLIARLRDPNLSAFERQGIMDKLAAAGRIDEVIAMMKEAAQNATGDADRQVDFGMAMIAKLRSGKISQMEQAGLAMAADKAFDNALKIDERHWNARFNKAISLSFWPPVMGKQPEAIRHFETLLSQQGEGAPSPEHAQTHIWLGNLYQQTGNTEQAQETWASGAALFPDNEELQSHLNGN